ncbi:MAG: sigma-54-dependent Fis family transcriptional regulator [Acidobacteriaceae bacterium]|nr:sigma-54-dependent Fis family transcriptional regulator [Acidobacteriaceae bacterium]
MAITKPQAVLCVTHAVMLQHLQTVATELDVSLVEAHSTEALLSYAELARAAAIVVEVSEFSSQTSQLMDALRAQAPDVPIIVLLEKPSAADAIRFSRYGASDCLDCLSTTEQFFSALQISLAASKNVRESTDTAAAAEPWRKLLVGRSVPMEQISKVIRLIASRRCTVLISGETGTGKEVVAKAIHMASSRGRRPMVSVNCGAIPENLVEAELFGHVKGAFTGAVNHRIGRFEQANGGTLFLDEIADLPLELQSKLLRALQEKEIQRLGGSETLKVDVRVIAATNADLLARVREGRFREDLYYRLNVVPIHLPTLRGRACDIPLLIEHFVRKVCEAEGIAPKSVSPEAVRLLSGHSWPGNVRQLENAVEHAVVMSGDREYLYASDFSLRLDHTTTPAAVSQDGNIVDTVPGSQKEFPEEGLDFTETLRQFERAILQEAMSRAQGNKTVAADMLKLPRTTLIHKLRVLDTVM